jgi:hypothetical protein
MGCNANPDTIPTQSTITVRTDPEQTALNAVIDQIQYNPAIFIHNCTLL